MLSIVGKENVQNVLLGLFKIFFKILLPTKGGWLLCSMLYHYVFNDYIHYFD